MRTISAAWAIPSRHSPSVHQSTPPLRGERETLCRSSVVSVPTSLSQGEQDAILNAILIFKDFFFFFGCSTWPLNAS